MSEERGSGTVLALGIIAALVMLLAVIHVVTAAATARAQAASAADLAALAAADTARGLAVGDPCTVAEQTAQRNGAEVLDCRVGGEWETEVWVTAHVELPLDPGLTGEWTLGPLRAEHTSRAGPPEALPRPG
ncbi:Rv3654c family TadE-like protein [Nesterenkonia alba]|uniref:Rv3654c family TadE-like protein n=1 Tax=Nesterenkonia alba TaxID=515814 RepID=UPI0003B5422A|nr:Rv3654c family TadE-like protein [Nesterenkonia alba]